MLYYLPTKRKRIKNEKTSLSYVERLFFIGVQPKREKRREKEKRKEGEKKKREREKKLVKTKNTKY